METQERHYALEHLAKSETRMLAMVEGLTPAQWSFKESSERWSIAQNVEHCVLIEDGLLGVIRRTLETPADPVKRAAAEAKKGRPDPAREAAAGRLESPAAFLPQGKWIDGADLVAELRRVRATTVEFTRATDADLHDHFYPHFAMGDLDCYDWLMLLSHHVNRHARQIEAVKASAGYPA